MNIRVIAAMACLGLLADSAFGQAITLENPGFELPGTVKIQSGFDTAGSDVPGWSNTGTVYTDSGVEMGGVTGWRAFLRSTDDGIFQTSAHNAAVNEQFTLNFWASSTWQTTEVTGGIFYLDSGGQRQTLASLGAVVGNGTGSGPFAEYSVDFTVPQGSAAIGRPIGVFFDNTSANTGDAWAGLDDVSLSVMLVPEPGAVSLAGLLALPLLRRRRRG